MYAKEGLSVKLKPGLCFSITLIRQPCVWDPGCSFLASHNFNQGPPLFSRSFLVIGTRRSGVNTSTRNSHISKAWSQIMTKHTSCRRDRPWPRARATGPIDSWRTQRLPPLGPGVAGTPADGRRSRRERLRPPTRNQTLLMWFLMRFGCDGWVLFCCEGVGSLSKGQIHLLFY